MKVSVSITKVKKDRKETILELNNTDCDYIHVDTMDGNFVKEKQLSYEEFNEINEYNKKPLDVHLMVDNPSKYIINFKNLNTSIITIHSEINKNINDLIDLIHSYKIKAGISINPNTPVKNIEKYLKKVDNVLIMSVEPGLGGQTFMDNILPKINELISLRKKNNYNYLISIDGGINNETIKKVSDVDMVISGSYICLSDNMQEKINSLRFEVKNNE